MAQTVSDIVMVVASIYFVKIMKFSHARNSEHRTQKKSDYSHVVQMFSLSVNCFNQSAIHMNGWVKA